MGKKTGILLWMMIMLSFLLYPVDFDGTISLQSSLNSITLKYDTGGEEEPVLDTLNFITMGAGFATDLTENLKLGLVVGYSLKKYSGPLYFERLPLSLGIENQSFNSMFFGMCTDYRFYYIEYFSFAIAGEVKYFRLFELSRQLDLPIVEGEASIQNSFITATLDLLIKFDQIPGITVYLGPEVYLLSGSFKAVETLGELEGEESVTFNQDRFFSLLGGAQVEVMDVFEVKVEVRFLSHFSVRCEIMYEF
jgi:hypothetical protein